MEKEQTTRWDKINDSRADADKCSWDSQAPSLLPCLLLSTGKTICDEMSVRLLKSQDSDEKIIGHLVKAFGNILEIARNDQC